MVKHNHYPKELKIQLVKRLLEGESTTVLQKTFVKLKSVLRTTGFLVLVQYQVTEIVEKHLYFWNNQRVLAKLGYYSPIEYRIKTTN